MEKTSHLDVIILVFWKKKEATLKKLRLLSKKSCDRGYSLGCHNLRILEYHGNIEVAAINLTKSCDGGNPNGCVDLGWLEKERGNLEEAVAAYEKSCDGGNPDGCYYLGNLELERGNYDEAVAAYEKSCKGGSDYGCTRVWKAKSLSRGRI